MNIQERRNLGKSLSKSISSSQSSASQGQVPASPIKMQVHLLEKLIHLRLLVKHQENLLHCTSRQTCHSGVTEVLASSCIFLLLIIWCFHPLHSPISPAELLTCPRWIVELQSNNAWSQEINFLMFLLQPSFIAPYTCLIFSLTLLTPNIYFLPYLPILEKAAGQRRLIYQRLKHGVRDSWQKKELRRNGCGVDSPSPPKSL